MSAEWMNVIVIIAAGIIAIMAMIFWRCGLGWYIEARYLMHTEKRDWLVSEEVAIEAKELFRLYLTKVVPNGPFGEDKDPLYCKWIDRLGRTVLTENRWSGQTYYYLNVHWLDILDEEWPVFEGE